MIKKAPVMGLFLFLVENIWSAAPAPTPSAAKSSAADQGDQEEDDKDEEEDFSYRCGARGDAEESECTRYKGYDQEDDCPA